jgi:hypothetical protein
MLTWQSTPTFPTDHTVNSNSLRGNGINAGASMLSNTDCGLAPSRPRCERAPATCRHHTNAASCISCKLLNVRPRQNESRT